METSSKPITKNQQRCETLQKHFLTHKFLYALSSFIWTVSTFTIFITIFLSIKEGAGVSIAILALMLFAQAIGSIVVYKISTMEFPWNEIEVEETGKLFVDDDANIQPPPDFVLPSNEIKEFSSTTQQTTNQTNPKAVLIVEEVIETRADKTPITTETIEPTRTALTTENLPNEELQITKPVEEPITDIFGSTNSIVENNPEPTIKEEPQTHPNSSFIDDNFDIFN